jgi:RNA polymerase sigma-70 factor (ECF subfamily)
VELQVETRWHAEDLYLQHAGALVGFAASIVGSADAEDVVASVAARIFDSAALAAADNPKAYLYQAVLNAARSHLRSRFRRQRRERKIALERARSTNWDGPGPDLSSVLDALSPRQRAVVHLTYWEELTGPEVAQRLGISEGSVRTHLARAKNVLRGLIDG